MRLVVVVAALAAIAGCKKDTSTAGGSGSGTAAAAGSFTGTCNDAIDHSVDGMIAKKKQEGSGSGTMSPDRLVRLEKLRGVLGTRCTEDKWSPSMLACVANVTAQRELMQCMSANLDKQATARAMGDITNAMMGGRPMSGFGAPMHPGMDLDSAYQKRIGAVTDKLATATAALATAPADGKAAAQAEVDKLTREKAALEQSMAQMKAMHPGPLQGASGSGSGSGK